MRIAPPVRLTFPFLASLALLSACTSAPLNRAGSETFPTGYTPPTLPTAMNFPSAKIVKVTDEGAVGDGKTSCSDAINKAIDACSAAGGGVVEFPKGTFFTAPIHLKSNITLQVDEGATIKFSSDPKDFPLVKTRYECTDVMNYSPCIYAYQCQNIRITGKGTIDGQGKAWWAWKDDKKNDKVSRATFKFLKQFTDDREGKFPIEQRVFGDAHPGLRPCLIEPYECKNVLIEGVTVRQSPFWTIHPLYTENMIVRNATIFGGGANTDGCDPDSSRNMLIEGCSFMTGDDCIAIKSGRDGDGIRRHMPTENITIRNCVMTGGHGAITMGSETSGGIYHVFAENCMIDGPDSAIRLKSTRGRGGGIEDVYVRNCTISKTKQFAITIDTRYGLKNTRFDPEALSAAMMAASKDAKPTTMPSGGAGSTAAGAVTTTSPAEDADADAPLTPPAPAWMPKSEKTPIFRNIRIENVTCGDSIQAIWILGLPEAPIENVTLKNVYIKADIGAHVENVRGFHRENVHVDTSGPWTVKAVYPF